MTVELQDTVALYSMHHDTEADSIVCYDAAHCHTLITNKRQFIVLSACACDIHPRSLSQAGVHLRVFLRILEYRIGKLRWK